VLASAPSVSLTGSFLLAVQASASIGAPAFTAEEIRMFQLYVAIWRVSGRKQIVLMLLSLAVAALAAAPLKFQKDIVNLLGQPSFEKSRLLVLGTAMIGVVLLSLALKWATGYLSGILGDDVIRTIRRRVLDRALDSPADERQAMTGSVSTAISAEAEELGMFAGSAFVEPIIQIGTLVSVIGFIAATQPRLGLLALFMMVPQVAVVVLTQPKVNSLVKDRVRVLRKATDKVSASDLDSLAGEVREDFDTIFRIRKGMYLIKTSTKFLLSAINGAGMVAVLMLGGLLVMRGTSDVGTVVAATLGLSRIQAPTAFLIAFFRQISSNRVKFDLLRSLFPS
jgi:ABC-type bacteriocin/lantibiotic exporter with double-glycine peptidase domain